MTDLFKATLAVLLMTVVAFASDAAAVSIVWQPVPYDRFVNSDVAAWPIIAIPVAAVVAGVAITWVIGTAGRAVAWMVERVGRRIVSSLDRFSAWRQ